VSHNTQGTNPGQSTKHTYGAWKLCFTAQLHSTNPDQSGRGGVGCEEPAEASPPQPSTLNLSIHKQATAAAASDCDTPSACGRGRSYLWVIPRNKQASRPKLVSCRAPAAEGRVQLHRPELAERAAVNARSRAHNSTHKAPTCLPMQQLRLHTAGPAGLHVWIQNSAPGATHMACIQTGTSGHPADRKATAAKGNTRDNRQHYVHLSAQGHTRPDINQTANTTHAATLCLAVPAANTQHATKQVVLP
jgi:hypothetical protein